ncbi:MAG TPA: FAD binding domain-containing protein [Terriglobia bacterium]|nr:FAD binding domain-containing protein [Terriglobia bacterium]
MERFEYASPKSRKEAVGLLGSEWGHTEVIAGGTDLVGAMKDYAVTPKRVVSLKHISDLRGVRVRSGELHIGSMTTLREVMDDHAVKQNYPAVYEAIEEIHGEQIRNMATAGGSLLQRPRCWYYRLGYGLLAERDGKSMVSEGDNRYHAILGNSGPAKFVSPSTLAPVLIALNAEVALDGPGGVRRIALEKLYTTPTEPGQREHTLRPNEILTEVIVPHAAGVRSAMYELRQKEELDWPLSTAAVALELSGGTVRHARIVLGHVAPVPWVSPEASQAIEGKTISEETADAAGQAAVRNATPLSMNGYKVQLTRVAVKRAILKARGA